MIVLSNVIENYSCDGYGIKINNFESATLFEYNLGLRDAYQSTKAVLANSLFKDFLMDNGLKIENNFTKDIICLEFNFGTRQYEKENKHLRTLIKDRQREKRIAIIQSDSKKIEQNKFKVEQLIKYFKKAHVDKDTYKERTRQEVRRIYYTQGVTVKYPIWGKDKTIKGYESIHYKMLFRSVGKAKKGSCMFIRDELYQKAHDFLYMGITLPPTNADIVSISAYVPLISSGIVGEIKIDPKNILVLKDVERPFKREVISVECNEQKQCQAIRRQDYELKNNMFDGQGLIDSSIFPQWADGWILLRQHFCKMAVFNTNIQLFFKDYFGDQYESAELTDMWGNKHLAKDIVLITTESAMKWLKFNISYEYWCNKVNENNNWFGIVKTSHESKIGELQQMSYQMINCLDMNTMQRVLDTTQNYMDDINCNDESFLRYLDRNKNFSNDFEAIVYLCRNNPDMINSEYVKARRIKICQNEFLNIRSGKVLQYGQNLTLLGSPYAMLLYSASGNPDDVNKDPTFQYEEGTIQAYSENFKDEYIGCFRSPHNSANNILYFHSVKHELFDRYFKFGRYVLAVNVNGTDVQDRGNGLN